MEIDNIMKSHKVLFEHIYKSFSGHNALPGGKNSMMRDEFEAFCERSGLQNDLLTTREASLHFNLSIFTQVDEIEKRRHLEATPLEFMEMIVRVCDDSSWPPYMGLDEDGVEIPSEMSEKKRIAQPLDKKIENAIRILMSSSIDDKFKKSFKRPKRDAKSKLFKLKNGKYF